MAILEWDLVFYPLTSNKCNHLTGWLYTHKKRKKQSDAKARNSGLHHWDCSYPWLIRLREPTALHFESIIPLP